MAADRSCRRQVRVRFAKENKRPDLREQSAQRTRSMRPFGDRNGMGAMAALRRRGLRVGERRPVARRGLVDSASGHIIVRFSTGAACHGRRLSVAQNIG